jgi:predicted dehydrogenase
VRNITRRNFIRTSLAGVAGAVSVAARPLRVGANDRLRVAVVGARGQGGLHVRLLSGMEDVEVAAVCDIDERVFGGVGSQVEKKTGRKPRFEKDLRRLLEDKSIDAISIATPNHWHVLAAVWSVQAGKDVYVEKPVSYSVWEGRKLVEAARKHGRLVQHGTYSRSNSAQRDALKFLGEGKLGAVKLAQGRLYRPRTPIGTFPDEPVPPGVDYDLWLGPAPLRPFNKNRFHYNWHWNWDYGNGEIGNNGVYQLDTLVWGLGKSELPKKIIGLGGRVGLDDAGQTPNFQVTFYDYGDVQIVHEVRGLELENETDRSAFKTGASFECAKGRLAGTTATGPGGEVIQKFLGGGAHLENFRNFVDAVKARRAELLNADVLGGHLAAGLCHLANISYRLGEERPLDAIDAPFGASEAGNEAFRGMRDALKAAGFDPAKTRFRTGHALTLDPKTERFEGDAKANELLRREYRKPFVVPDEA